MNELITLIIHLTQNSKHIIKMFAIHQFSFLSQCLRGHFREVWTWWVLSYERWAVIGERWAVIPTYTTFDIIKAKPKFTPHCWWSGNPSSILCTWELVCHVCYFRLRNCTKFLYWLALPNIFWHNQLTILQYANGKKNIQSLTLMWYVPHHALQKPNIPLCMSF